MYTEDELLPISALQHLAFCERQWGLIHLEGAWEENLLTTEGRILHDRSHESETEVRGDIRIARGLRLRSLRLGLVGMADVVEFHRVSNGQEGITIDGVAGLWKPFIVEYKRGRPKIGHEDEIQVCAQALCLEEMLSVSIPSGALFYGQPRRRSDVIFDHALRNETESLAEHLHHLNSAGITPPASHTKICKSCSLVDLCLPKATDGKQGVRCYLSRAIASAVENIA